MQTISLELIGMKIREERLKRGLTQDGLGELIYLHGSRISCMERGEGIQLDKLELIANALNIDVRELFHAGVIDCQIDYI